MNYYRYNFGHYNGPVLGSKMNHQGSASPIVPILAAFVFFLLFLTGSLWFISRSRSPAAQPQGTSPGNFPTAPTTNVPSGTQIPNGSFAPGFPNQSPTQSAGSSSPSPFGSPSLTPGHTVNLDAASARQLVESWLSHKKTIFSSPYDLSRLSQYVVDPGPLYSDITRSGGSVDWLKTNKASYFYKELNILNVSDFRQFPDRAHLTVKVLEDLELRTPQGTDKSKSGRKSQSWIYELKLHNGKWLVYDYRKDV